MGIGGYLNPIPETLAMVGDTRAATASGHTAAGAVVYCYDTPASVNGQEAEGDTALFAALPRVWTEDVPTPVMAWKEHPTTGTILGTLLSGNLTPLDGAALTARRLGGGVPRRAVADGNGCFEFAGLPPGSYRVSIAALGTRYRLETLVRPGHAAWLTLVGKGAAAVVTRIPGLGSRPEGELITLGKVVVSSGSDRLGDHFFVTDDLGLTPVQVNAPKLVPPTVRGDEVYVTGRLHQTSGGVVLEASAVRLVGIAVQGSR